MPSSPQTSPVQSLLQTLVPCLIPIVLLIALLSVAGYLGESRILELTAHFKVQYFIISSLACLVFGIARKRWFWLISLACLVANLVVLAPWYLPQPGLDADGAGQALRLVVANVNSRNQDYARVVNWIKQEQPDVVVFMEVNEPWLKALEAIRPLLPYTLAESRDDNFGIAVYSALQPDNAEIERLGNADIPSVLVELNLAGKLVSIVATHPFPPVSQQAFRLRNVQLDAVGRYIQQLRHPTLLLGDLNLTMWSPQHQRLVQQTGLRNARRGFGVLPTWPTYNPLLYIPLDHCLVSSEVQVIRSRTGRAIGSDHLPLIVDAVVHLGGQTSNT